MKHINAKTISTGLLLLILMVRPGTDSKAKLFAEGYAQNGENSKWLPEKGNVNSVAQDVDDFLQSLGGSIRLLYCKYSKAQLLHSHQLTSNTTINAEHKWQTIIYTSPVESDPTAMDLNIRFHLKTGTIQEGGVAVAFDFVNWSTENYVMLPASVYNGNRCKLVRQGYNEGIPRKLLYKKNIPLISVPIPQLSPDADSISRLEVNACNMATPAMCFFSPEKKHGFIVLTQQKSACADNGFSIEESADRKSASFVISAPGVREKKPMFIGFAESTDRGADLYAGDHIDMQLRIYAFEAEDIPALLSKFMAVRKDVTGQNSPRNLIPFSQVAGWMTERIDSRWYAGEKFQFYCPENADWISFGWIGGLMNTFPMLALGDEMHRERVVKTFDFAIPRGQAASGYFHGALGHDGKCFPREGYPDLPELVLTRKNGDVLYWMIKQFLLLKEQGLADQINPDWEQHMQRLADAFVTTWKKNGQWGRMLNLNTGEVAEYNTSGGVMAIGGLALAASYFHKPEYLDIAKKASRLYYQRDFVESGQTTGGCADILQNADSETAAGFMTSLMALYEVTGDKQWLKKSQNLANLCATWTTSYDYELPYETELGRLGAKLAGIYWASTQNKHGAPGICTSSGDPLFKIYRATGNSIYAELMNDIVHAHGESIRPGGYTNERLTYCDADSRGERGNHVTGWNELNGLLMALELPGIYLQTDSDKFFVFDHVAAEVVKRDNSGVMIKITNPTKFDASVSIFAETAKQAIKPLGFTAFVNWPKAEVKSGESVLVQIDSNGKIIKRPNIILIMADDHAVNAVSAYGSKLIETPNIDRLAKQGTLFTNCFCTNSICNPSRASIMTGKYSHVHGVKTNYIKPGNDHVTYPELLKNAGYQTALVGKTHFLAETNCIKSLDYYMISHGAEYHDPRFLEKGRELQHYEGYVTDVVTDKALGWIQKCDRSRPFMLMIHHPAPHMPFQEKAALLESYKDNIYPEPASFNDPKKNQADSPRPNSITMEGLMGFQGRKNVWGEHAWVAPEGLEGEGLKKWIYQRYMRAYMACVETLDDNLGKMLRYLKTSGLEENTVVIYTSDQGFLLGEHGWYDKRFFYEESIHMPLIIRYPGIKGGYRCDRMVLNVDFPETILDIAGARIPDDMQGESFLALLTGHQKEQWRDAMYYHYYESREDSPLPVRNHYGIRTSGYKLIRFYNEKKDHWELFDLKKDPFELHNVYHDKAYINVRGELTQKLIQQRNKHGDNTGVFL